MDYQSDVYYVTVEAEDTYAEVSIAIFNDSIVKENETFTVDLSVPAAEAALGVSVSATDGTAYVEIQDDDKRNALRVHIIVQIENHKLRSDLFDSEWIARQNNSEGGSPCWTPSIHCKVVSFQGDLWSQFPNKD